MITGDPLDELGTFLVVVGDVDGDKVPDYAVTRKKQGREIGFIGQVDVRSGKDGSVIRSWVGDDAKSMLGYKALAALPDLDGDGVLEIGFSVVNEGIRVVSPTKGTTWYVIPPLPEAFGKTDETFAILSDIDGDGIDEFAAGTDESSLLPSMFHAGRVLCRSGRTGAVLWTRFGTKDAGQLGFPLITGGDFDRDGVPDLLTSEATEPLLSTETPYHVVVLSGRTGATLKEVDPPSPLHFWFGKTMASLGDRDGDGFPEIAIGAPAYRKDPNAHGVPPNAEYLMDVGWVGVYRLPAFEMLWSQEGRSPDLGVPGGDRLGESLSAAGDLDGDEVMDVLAAASRREFIGDPAAPYYGRLYLISGDTGKTLSVYEARQQDNYFFYSLRTLSDVDGDTRAEFLVASPTEPTRDGRLLAVGYEPESPLFLRGDATGDGVLNLTDAVTILLYTTEQGCVPGQVMLDPVPACPAAWDVNADGCIDRNDGLLLIYFLYLAYKEAPAPPFPDCSQFFRFDIPGGWPYALLDCGDSGSCRRE